MPALPLQPHSNKAPAFRYPLHPFSTQNLTFVAHSYTHDTGPHVPTNPCGNDGIAGEDDDCDWGITGPDDTLYGGPGNDSLSPYDGDGSVFGGDGKDYINADCSGRQKIYGGRGDDTIRANDYYVQGDYANADKPDHVACGPGRDTVYYDKGIDELGKDCEIKHPSVGTIQF